MIDDELIENLRKLTNEHEKHLNDIRDKIRVIDSVPRAKALVGKCFKTRSGGAFIFGGRSKGWTFKHVIAANGENVLVNSFTVEGPHNVQFSFCTQEYVSHFSHASLIQITEKVYHKEFKKLVKLLVKINKRGKNGK